MPKNKDKKKYKISINKNKKALAEYLKYIKANITDNPHTLENYEINIRKVLATINKDYTKLNHKDLDNTFSNIKSSGTRELCKTKFKAFLKYYNLNELADHIKINPKYFKTSTKTDNDILTEEEIKQLINSPNSIRDLAITELFLTTGIRREELTTLKVQNIEILRDEIKVKLTKSKFKIRNISIIPYPDNPIAFNPKNFFSYYNNHPFKNNKDKPLFYSNTSRTRGKELNPNSLTLLFNKVQKIAEISKKLTPHILRHTGATHDGYHLTEGQLNLKYGWNSGSAMAKRYCHLNEETFNNHLKQKAGLSPELIERESICPYCNHINNINSSICDNCKRTINKEEMAKQISDQEERDKKINDQIYELRKEKKELIRETEERFSKIEEQLNIKLNPDTPQTQNYIKYFRKMIPMALELKLGKKPTEKELKKELEEYDKLAPSTLSKLKNMPKDDNFFNLVKQDNLSDIVNLLFKKRN